MDDRIQPDGTLIGEAVAPDYEEVKAEEYGFDKRGSKFTPPTPVDIAKARRRKNNRAARRARRRNR